MHFFANSDDTDPAAVPYDSLVPGTPFEYWTLTREGPRPSRVTDGRVSVYVKTHDVRVGGGRALDVLDGHHGLFRPDAPVRPTTWASVADRLSPTAPLRNRP